MIALRVVAVMLFARGSVKAVELVFLFETPRQVPNAIGRVSQLILEFLYLALPVLLSGWPHLESPTS